MSTTYLSSKHPQLRVVVGKTEDGPNIVSFDGGCLLVEDPAVAKVLDTLAGMGVRKAYDHEVDDVPAAAVVADLLDVRLAPPGIPGAPRAGVGPAAAPVYDPEGAAEGRTDGGAPAGQVPPLRRGVVRSSTHGTVGSTGPVALVAAAPAAPTAPTLDPNPGSGSVNHDLAGVAADDGVDGGAELEDAAGEGEPVPEVPQPDEAADAAAQEHATKRAAAKRPPAKAARSRS